MTKEPASNVSPVNPVALVLGGGGIRGCAHAGTMMALQEYDIKPDIVVGASIGALFGAAYAAGWDADRIASMVLDAPRNATAKLYANRLRIDRKTYIGRILSELGTDTQIEDLPKRFVCMAVRKDDRALVALTTGPLLRSLQASIALPWIATPVSLDGRDYIDGGVQGPIPSIVARDLGAASILRVELLSRAIWRTKLRRYRSALFLRGSGPSSSGAPIVGDPLVEKHSSIGETIITPTFSGLSCNSPLGAKFCFRRGWEAAAGARLDLLSLNTIRT